MTNATPKPGKWILLFLLLLWALMTARCLAQDELGKTPPASPQPCNDETKFTGPPTTGPILSAGALPMGKGNFAIQPYLYVSFRGGQFNNNWQVKSARKDLINLNSAISVYYGLTENLWISIFWPYFTQNWAYNIENPRIPGATSAQTSGIGNMSVTFRYRFLAQRRYRPTVTGYFSVSVPLSRGNTVEAGTESAEAVGTRSWAFTGGVNLHSYLRPVIVYVNLWYTYATTDKETEFDEDNNLKLNPFNPRDAITFNVATETPFRWKGGPWVLLAELSTRWEVGPIFGAPSEFDRNANVLGLVGLEYIFNPKWRLAVGLAINLIGRNQALNYTPVITLYKPIDLFKKKRRKAGTQTQLMKYATFVNHSF